MVNTTALNQSDLEQQIDSSNAVSDFQIASLGSGSKGNATLIKNANTSVLIDCGFTLKETIIRAEKIGFDLSQLDAILVTHEHQDHIKGAGPLSRKFKLPIYATQGTYITGKLGKPYSFQRIKANVSFQIADFSIQPFSVPHDAREPCQFIVEYKDKSLGILSDLGSVTQPIIETLQQCNGLMLEMNHDYEMLMTGPYPYRLKQRVGGDLGHLNNHQALSLLKKMDLSNLELLVATHLSEKNNCPKLVSKQLNDLALENLDIQVASQSSGFDWISF